MRVRAYPALAPLRIGCVKYLNAKPLIHGYPGAVQFDHPAHLARDMVAGVLDAALVPVFEALGPRPYALVDGVAIASDGPVYSVLLAHRCVSLADIHTVALDPASLTSIHLLQVLLAEFHRICPRCVDARLVGAKADAQLLIGTQAIEFRKQAGPEWHILDLGEEWQRQTALPFVYALWLLRADLQDVGAIADEFRFLKCEGTARIAEIVASEKETAPEFATRYLTEHIRFELGSREKAGMERFRALLLKHGFLHEPLAPLRWV